MDIDKSHIRKEGEIGVRDHPGEILGAAQMKGRSLAKLVGGAEKILFLRVLDHVLPDLGTEVSAGSDIPLIIDVSGGKEQIVRVDGHDILQCPRT